MGAKASTANGGQSPRARTFSTSSSSEVVSGTGFSLLRAIPGIQVASDRQRARSLSSVPDLHASHEAIAIPANSQSYEASAAASPDTDSSSNEEPGPVPGTSLALGRVYAAHSLPSHIWSLNGESLTP
ncbi:E3 ubiquitin-protein ligase znrf2 isoform X2 [Phthorimaea operculella]|nr:E3 ubiquitin-protein ligase znrf2 isoform X2 [Phthorimaea operculella]